MDEPTARNRTRWDVVAALFGTTIVAVTVVPAYGLIAGYSWWLWGFFALFLLWNGLSITAGYHRLWSHKSYEAHPLVRGIFALGGALSLQNTIKEWCSNHRKHHRYTDDVDLDPYSAKRGFFFSHIGWMLRDYPATEPDYSNIKDLARDPVVNWQEKWYWHLAFALNVLVPLALGALAGDALGGFLVIGVLRLAICHHSTFFINSLAHAWGHQPYSDRNTSRDNPVVALLTYGEGYHNFHHTFQWDYRNGIRWWQFDPTKWLIRTLSWLRLTHSLKRVAPEKIEQCVAAMQLKKATERISHFQPINMQQWLDLLEAEYDKLVATLNEWSDCRQEWMELKRESLQKKWEETELKSQLSELEERLQFQRRQWRLLTQQFA